LDGSESIGFSGNFFALGNRTTLDPDAVKKPVCD
jgi:hypothetical protein